MEKNKQEGPMSRMIAAGHICLDITPVFPAGKVYDNLNDAMYPGKLVNVGNAEIHLGGCVSNTGLAMKKLGADVELLGKVGDDDFGRTIERILASHGAGGLIVDKNCSTSYSVVVAVPGLDRMFLHNPGANDTFLSSDIPDSVFDGAGYFHFGYPPLMKTMYEDGGDELAKILKRAKDKGLVTSLDMSFVEAGSPSGRADWQSILRKTLPYVDYFMPSLEEVSAMFGGTTDTEEIAKACLAYGAKAVVIKCGTDGMYYRTEDRAGHQKAFKAPFVASATGAGDVSIAAFLVAISRGEPLERAVALACAEGCCSVTSYDSLGGIKPLEELEDMIK